MTCSSCRRRRNSETAAEAIFKGDFSGRILAFDIAAAGPSIRGLIGKTGNTHGLRVPALIHRRGTFLHESERRQLELPVVLPHENRLPGCLSQNVTALILILAPSLPANKARSAA
jgi:hypothetical protein